MIAGDFFSSFFLFIHLHRYLDVNVMTRCLFFLLSLSPQWGDYVIFQKSQVVSHVNVTIESVLDGGLYTCTAGNRLGSISHSVVLRVEGRSRIREMANRSAVEGESVWLPCWILGSDAVLIHWTKGQ